ncbi:MAG: hypothetical protein Q9182_004317 [Xanthomendoza sp. 2 TL-2023]
MAPEPIAIVGSGCRFPGGSTSPSKLWDLVQKPRDVSRDITHDRVVSQNIYHPVGIHHGTTNVQQAYLLQEDIRVFDATFFNISPTEADSMDVQQRLLLETVYEALEAGGHTIDTLRGSNTAVYVGTMNADYNDTLVRDLSTAPVYFGTGTNRAIISNRVSYFFDWHGPSMTIDTACSSSLIAVHQGVTALRTGESRVALACGTQVILEPEQFIVENNLGMLSPTSRSRMWDAEADGYARGEGTAAIVLKRLSDAIADGDHIECLIRATGANQDGYSGGLTVPNSDAQSSLIRQTYERAGLDLRNPQHHPQFFEAHGTGTKTGDPKEAAAIQSCFGGQGDNDSPLYVGSIKTVIGHTEAYSEYLGLHGDINASNLAWTLQYRKSHFAIKTAFSATTIEQLKSKIDKKLGEVKDAPGTSIGVRSAPKNTAPRVLGVFTGQGAQWAAMGERLIRASDFVRARFKVLEDSLATLPSSDRPQWHLVDEILAPGDQSRLSEAELSQPLCTAIQIILVDLLQTAGITLSAVVGHSSGEIAAAYAAGFISAQDAIRIAYYRGLYARQAKAPSNNQKGAMLAVGTSWEDAQDLVNLRTFRGRLAIAAHNSSASVTLSGDADAIIQAKKVFDEEKKFARMLKVDTAYHSHHMVPCGDPYISSLRACEIRTNDVPTCSWFSSVNPSEKAMASDEALQGNYWRDNMTNAVLFAEAVKNAVASDQQLNLAVEVGPHPALRGPALQNISDDRSAAIPYCGTLNRGTDDIEAISDALGFVWSHFGTQGVDFQAYEKAISTTSQPGLLVGLPSYQFNHTRKHWHEPRRSRKMRAEKKAFHELLGIPSPDSTTHDMRWTNVLKMSEISWLEGHKLQDQTIFPAAGYVALGLEAARSLAADRNVELFEIQHLIIQKALVFDDNSSSGVEILVTLTAIHSLSTTITHADFSCYACPVAGSETEMELKSRGKVKIVFGLSSHETLASTPLDTSNMSTIETDQFYSSISKIGYQYTGPFRAMSSLKRKLNQASALISTYPYTDADVTKYLVHPTHLDVAIQAAMLAHSAPGDERLWSLHVPTSLGSIAINPDLCAASESQVLVCAVLDETENMSASIDVFSQDGQQALIQIENLALQPFAPATKADDRPFFSSTKWDYATPNGVSIVRDIQPSPDEVRLARVSERISYYYLRNWRAEITDDEWMKGQSHHPNLRDYMNHTLSAASTGGFPWLEKEWLGDTSDDIETLINEAPESIDMRLLSTVGKNIPAAVRGETTILEHMLSDNMLDEYYTSSLGFVRFNSFLASMMKQLTHRYPHARILEIGAGTGGATKSILACIGEAMSSYTYTDVSVGFFGQAAEVFEAYRDKMTFKILDIEKTPATQGFEPYSYDFVVAANVLHATVSLKKTLENTRQLLKPGGHLLLLEVTNSKHLRHNTIMGALPGWWLGVDEGRTYSPTVSPGEWHSILRKTGFSGIDAITPEIDPLSWPFSVLTAQAVDDRVQFLRRPLGHDGASIFLENVVVLGTSSLESARIGEELEEQLKRFCSQFTTLHGLPTENEALSLYPMSTFINLVDIDSPIFRGMTAEKMEGLKRMFGLAKNIIWITMGALADEPYYQASIDFSRTMAHEAEHVNLNHFDVSDLDHNVSQRIAEHLLRQCALDQWAMGEQEFLWSKESEIFLDRGQLKVPRVVDNANQNARLNSSRRAITKTVPITNTNVSIKLSPNSFASLVEESFSSTGKQDRDLVRVQSSSLMALHITAGVFLFLAIGTENTTQETVLVLSTANSCEVHPIVRVPAKISDHLLINVASDLLAMSLLELLSPGGRILVHCLPKDRFFAAALTRQAAANKVHVRFACGAQVQDPTWIKLSARTPKHVLRRLLLPVNPTYFLDLVHQSELGLRIAGTLPLACKQIDPASLAHHQPLLHQSSAEVHLRRRLEKALGTTSTPLDYNDAPIIQVSNLDASNHMTNIVRWPLQGDIMVKPMVDEKWLESFKERNATVKVFSMDVTDKQSVERVVNEIKSTCPCICGVINGAMVLRDSLFSNMSADQMQQVLAPKIDGTNNLDEIFYNDELDFFVLFSSAACVFGNAGQANYSAANGYINSFARKRRNRGLAASAVEIGQVAGIGYVVNASQTVKDQLTKLGMTPISEPDYHQMLAETIRAGFPTQYDQEAMADAVVSTGVRKYLEHEQLQGPWMYNSRFWHRIIKTEDITTETEGQNKKTLLPVRERLAGAASKDRVIEILIECFSAKLQTILQMADSKIEIDTPLVELGVDSLVAVEVRSWFLKELKVEISVLKVVGGASVAELCQLVLDKLPKELLAGIGQEPKKSTATGSSTASEHSDSQDSKSGSSTQLTTASPPTKHSTPAVTERKFLKVEPISFGQSRFWFLGHLLEDQTTFNVAFYYHVNGHLRVGDLERAVRIITMRHEALRTCFVEDPTEADQAHQKVMSSSAIRLEHKEIKAAEDVAVEFAKLKVHAFDLANGDTVRILLLSLSKSTHYLLINYHHILLDGSSVQVLISDLEKAYNNTSLGSPPRQYPDFSATQRQNFESGEMNDELRYWKNMFPAGEQLPVLPLLPMARTGARVTMKKFDTHQVGCRLDARLATKVKSLSKAQRSTPFHLYLAAFKTMLFRFMDEQDLIVGIADANRGDSDIIGSMGFYLNLLSLRFRRQPEQSFADAIVEARDTTYAALENSRVPFDVLLKELNVARTSTHSPFFQAFFDYHQGAQEKQSWGNCQFEIEEVHMGRTAYDITLDVTDNATDALIMIRAQKSLYDLTAAKLLLETFIHIMDTLSTDKSIPFNATPLFRQMQMIHANEGGRDQIALMDGTGKVLTYADMINRIESIGEALQSAGSGAGSRVLVFQQATADWVCSMLAIMRVGSVYVPLDLRNPLPRLAAVATDCMPSAVLVDGSTFEDAAQLNVPNATIINISKIKGKSKLVPNLAQPDSLAAILYTSGSTGTPKGIMVTHSGLRNEIEGYTKTWNLGAERVLQQSAFTFNHSSDQIYTGLVNGGMVYIVPWSKRGDPIEITKIIQQNSITYTKATPSEYSLWMQYGGDNLRQANRWRCAFGGGELLSSIITQQFADLRLGQLHVYNSYGPTEISISSHKMEVEYRDQQRMEDGRIPCGFSLPNYTTYVVDDDLKLLPAGMPGEICIGGAGVSLGYLNNEELTEQSFVPDPFASPEDVSKGWTRMYRTGDIGHLQEDGAMVFHRRMAGDTQVKIRGLRIELSDIESNIISAAKGVLREVIVTLREGDPEFLVAHVLFAPQHGIRDKEAFLENLLSGLPIPQYMIPVAAIPLDQLPLTNHSKVDRKAIKQMPLTQRTWGNHESAELTETMAQLKRIWRDVLGNNHFTFDITPSTSFFLVGGNSLLIIRLQSRIRQVFNVNIGLVELLGGNTLGRMAGKIEESPVADPIDWEAETAPPSIPSFLKDGMEAQHDQPKAKVVLITGATGFFAKHIIPQLAANGDISTIHCVAVRDRPPESLEQVPSSPKVVSYSGDLTVPLLGLSEDDFKALSRDVDVILHMGALRSFWDSYQVIRPSNVHPTKELIKLAAPRRIPIHYISTIGVLPWGSTVDAVSAAPFSPPVDGTNGYVASRWTSERVLERSAASLGIPATIYRFLSSKEQSTSQTVLDELVRFVDLSGKKPDMSAWKGRMDLAPVSEAARWVCESMAHDEAKPATRFLHHESPISLEVANVVAYIEEQRGQQDMELMLGVTWFRRIKNLGFGYLITSQDAFVESSAEGEGGAKFASRSVSATMDLTICQRIFWNLKSMYFQPNSGLLLLKNSPARNSIDPTLNLLTYPQPSSMTLHNLIPWHSRLLSGRGIPIPSVTLQGDVNTVMNLFKTWLGIKTDVTQIQANAAKKKTSEYTKDHEDLAYAAASMALQAVGIFHSTLTGGENHGVDWDRVVTKHDKMKIGLDYAVEMLHFYKDDLRGSGKPPGQMLKGVLYQCLPIFVLIFSVSTGNEVRRMGDDKSMEEKRPSSSDKKVKEWQRSVTDAYTKTSKLAAKGRSHAGAGSQTPPYKLPPTNTPPDPKGSFTDTMLTSTTNRNIANGQCDSANKIYQEQAKQLVDILGELGTTQATISQMNVSNATMSTKEIGNNLGHHL